MSNAQQDMWEAYDEYALEAEYSDMLSRRDTESVTYDVVEKMSDEIISKMSHDEKMGMIAKHREHKIRTGTGISGCLCSGCMEEPIKKELVPFIDDGDAVEGSMFTRAEEETFAINLMYRQEILRDMFKDGIAPDDNSSRRIVNELVTSVDSALLTRAKIRHQIKNDAQVNDLARSSASILMEIAKAKANVSSSHTEETIVEALPSEFIGVDRVPGHMTKGKDFVDPAEFFTDDE